MSETIIDNVGITVKLSSLPSYPEYKRLEYLLFGDSYLTWFWRRIIYRVLFPRKYNMLADVHHDVVIALQQELLNATIEQGISAQGE